MGALADNYSAPAGTVIRGGRTLASSRPAWRTAMAPNTWTTIPGNKLVDLNPVSNPAMNPYYGTATAVPWNASGGHAGIINAWSGMAYDYATDTMWFPLQGGHNDWGGNEPYKRSLRADTANFVMLRPPSGALPQPIVDITATQNPTGYFSDGRIVPGHSYNNNTYVPGRGPVVSRIAGLYPSGNAGLDQAFAINETTGEAALIGPSGNLGSGYGASEYDASRNCLWMTGTTNTPLLKMDLATGVTTTAVSGNNYVNGYPRLIYLPTPDVLLVAHRGVAGSGYPASTFYLWDLKTTPPTLIPVTTTGAFPSSHDIYGGAGMDWDYTNNRLLLWNTRTDQTTLVSVLTPGANLRTDTWAISVLPVSGANAVTPTAATASGGVFGRFRYSSYLGGCLLLNATNEPTYFFATE